MSSQTLNQRLRNAELDLLANQPLVEAAASAWEKRLAEERISLANLLKRTLHRTPDSFPAPIKGRDAVAEVEGLIFVESFDESNRKVLAIIIVCPTCDEPKKYRVTDYAELGERLSNAEHDRRCRDCIEHNRRET